MEDSEQYRLRVLWLLEKITCSGNPVVIFGAGRAGWYIMKVLEYHDVPIAAFCDNDPEKQNSYCGYRVISAADTAKEFPSAHLLLGLFLPETAMAIQKQFLEGNFQDVYFATDAFLFYFLVHVAGRRCDKRVLAQSIRKLFLNYREGVIHYGYTNDNYFVSPFVTSVITQKCSLSCRDCAQLIPSYQNPVNFPVASVVADLKQYAKAFDVVPEISLHGGEPFLHPQLEQICREVAAIPNIVFISFVTNGTVMPSEEVLRQFSASGADVHQSGGYGDLSRKQKKLTEAFHRNNIYADVMFCSPTEQWVQSPPPRRHCRPAGTNDVIYNRCVQSKVCCQIMDGELHRCPLSMHGSHQGLFPKSEGDFVRLHGPGIQDQHLVNNIRCFLTRKRAFDVCDYCDPDGGVLVPPAIQLP